MDMRPNHQSTDSEIKRVAHYRAMAEGAKVIAQARQDAFNALVDFVEQHGGALSGEQRAVLWYLSQRIR
jgi:hypothetical protein